MEFNIVLIGFMGAGKSSVGQFLAHQLNANFVDIDEQIEKHLNLSINEIFAEYGEPFFRQIEKELVRQVACLTNCVISTGGGVVLDRENVQLLKQCGIFIWLYAPPAVLYERAQNLKRPLLQTPNPYHTLCALLQLREPLYRKYADFVVDTTNLSVAQTTQIIIRYLSSLN